MAESSWGSGRAATKTKAPACTADRGVNVSPPSTLSDANGSSSRASPIRRRIEPAGRTYAEAAPTQRSNDVQGRRFRCRIILDLARFNVLFRSSAFNTEGCTLMRTALLVGMIVCPSVALAQSEPSLRDLMRARGYAMGGAFRAVAFAGEALVGNPAAMSL